MQCLAQSLRSVSTAGNVSPCSLQSTAEGRLNGLCRSVLPETTLFPGSSLPEAWHHASCLSVPQFLAPHWPPTGSQAESCCSHGPLAMLIRGQTCHPSLPRGACHQTEKPRGAGCSAPSSWLSEQQRLRQPMPPLEVPEVEHAESPSRMSSGERR